MNWEKSFTMFGITFIVIGIALIIIPLIVKSLPAIEIEKVPWFLLYVYRKDDFLFATSPILILISIIFLLWTLLH